MKKEKITVKKTVKKTEKTKKTPIKERVFDVKYSIVIDENLKIKHQEGKCIIKGLTTPIVIEMLGDMCISILKQLKDEKIGALMLSKKIFSMK